MVLGTAIGVGWRLSGGLFEFPATLLGVGAALAALVIGPAIWFGERGEPRPALDVGSDD